MKRHRPSDAAAIIVEYRRIHVFLVTLQLVVIEGQDRSLGNH